jgi:hypothetical protein
MANRCAAGAVSTRPNPRAEWIFETMPELLIIDQET